MRINRILPRFFTTDIQGEEMTQKDEKSFEAVLQEEQEKLMRLILEAENAGNIKQFYFPSHPRMIDGLFSEDEFS